MSLVTELKRRNVFRVATAYLVVGWLLIEISTTLLPTFGAPEWVARALILFFALAFIPVIVFSWAFELTPEGIKREKDVDRDESITSDTGKKLNYVTIAAVVLGVAFLAWDKTGSQSSPPVVEEVVTVGAPSVAVLPFVNMSGSADNEYFSDGLTETLLHMLAQIPELRVAARTSSFAFKGDDVDIREIADALGVAHVLEGSVQRAGDRVRITAQLIRADDGFHVWSENFDRTLDDIFRIQDEIAAKVGAALSASLLGTTEPSPVVGVGTENLKAYDFYLRALAEQSKGSYGSLKVAEGLLKDALALDTGFLDAKTELARGYIKQWETGLIGDSIASTDTLALLEQVLADRPDDIQATGLLYFAEIFAAFFSGDSEAAKNSLILLEQHVADHPNDLVAALDLAQVLTRMNRPDEALEYLQSVLSHDPLNPALHYELSKAYESLDRYEESRTAALRALEIQPVYPHAQSAVATAEREMGDGVGWLDNYLKTMEMDPKDHEIPGHIAVFLYDLQLPEFAENYRSRVLSIAPSSPAAYALNMMHARAVGTVDDARRAAERAIEDDVDDRLNAYSDAAFQLASLAREVGTIEETLQYFEANIPHLLEFDTEVRFKYQISRFAAVELMYDLRPRAEVDALLIDLWEHFEVWGFDPESDPFAKTLIAAARGDLDAAEAVFVDELLAEPVADELALQYSFSSPFFREIVARPRAQEEILRWQTDKSLLRDQVRVYLQNLEP